MEYHGFFSVFAFLESRYEILHKSLAANQLFWGVFFSSPNY